MAYARILPADSHAAVERVLALLRAAPEGQFEPLTVIARHLLGKPIAAINFIEGDLLWNKVASGVAIAPMPRNESMCDQVVLTDVPIMVEDCLADARFAGSPLVTHGGLRFYAGVPLHSTDPDTGARRPIGAMCVADVTPGRLSDDQLTALRALGELAEAVIANHVSADRAIAIASVANAQAAALSRQERLFGHAERMAMIGSWRLRLPDNTLEWSPGVRRIHEMPDDMSLTLDQALDFYPPHARAIVTAALAHSIETGDPFDFEVDVVTVTGRPRRVRALGEVERTGTQDVALAGVFQDVTDRYHLEQRLRHSAATDTVTGIANRAAFDAALDHAIGRAAAGTAPCMLVLIDLDDFKRTNDTHGHLAGDDVLRAVGERLSAPWLDGAFAARLGGDEFALLLTDGAMCDRVELIVARLAADLARPVAVGTALLPCSATLGYAAFAPDLGNARELIHAADDALYDAKHRRRGSAVRHGSDPSQRRTG